MNGTENEGAVTLHRELFDDARQLAEAGQNRAAVVLAQTAAEVLTESVVWHWSGEENIDWIVELIDEFLTNYNPGNRRVRQVLEQGAGVKLADQEFWRDFKTHVKRRHQVVHEGVACGAHDAQHSLHAVERLIDYLEPGLKRRWHEGPN